MAIAWCRVCGGDVIGGGRHDVADPVPCPACGLPASLARLRRSASDPDCGAYDRRAEIEAMSPEGGST